MKKRFEIRVDSNTKKIVKYYHEGVRGSLISLMAKQLDEKFKFDIVKIEELLWNEHQKLEVEIERQSEEMIMTTILTSLSCEYNEKLREGILKDRWRGAISNYGKPFIKAQVDILEKEYEKIYGVASENIRYTEKKIEEAVEIISKLAADKLVDIDEMTEMYKAYLLEKKAVMGIVKKVLKRNEKQ